MISLTPSTSRPDRAPPRAPVVLKWIALILAVCVLASGLVLSLLPDSFWRGLIIRTVSRQTGRPVTIDGPVHVRLFSLLPEVSVEGFHLANVAWAEKKTLLTMQRVDVVMRLSSIFRRNLILPKVVIDGAKIDFERDIQGRTTWDFTPTKAPPTKGAKPMRVPAVQQLIISNGLLFVLDKTRKLEFEGTVAVDEKRDVDNPGALKVHGKGSLNEKPIDLQVSGPPLVQIDPTRAYAFDASVTAADIRLSTHVNVEHPFDLANLKASFTLSSNDLADVYYLTGLALPNTPPYHVSGTVERDNLIFRVQDLQGKVGRSDIAGTLVIDTAGDRPKLTGKFLSKEFNLADLAAPLGKNPSAASTATLKPVKGENQPARLPVAKASDPAQAYSGLLPDADLQVDRVRGMDADVLFDAASITTAKFPIKKLHFHLGLENGKLTLAPLSFILPQGAFAGTVAIDARGSVPRTDLDMRLSNVDLSQFTAKGSTAPPLTGPLLGRFRLHGVGGSVHKAASTADGDVTFVVPKGEMRSVLAELTGINLSRGVGLFLTKNDSVTEIRCGVANFHAHEGDLVANAFTIDTTHVLITGRGQVDLKSENIDLELGGQPKEVRFLRLRTPITVRGTLAHPQIGVDTGKALRQAGGAAALGALLTPFAAILAFVDGGLAKDANCSALLAPIEQEKGVHSKSH